MGTQMEVLIKDPQTSLRLSRIRQRDTGAELVVRRLIFRAGIRFRTRNTDLPGSPDIANRARKWVVFVHGCFWHRHSGCERATTPKRNRQFWLDKFAANRRRDQRVERQLRRCGYKVIVVWECEARRRNLRPLTSRLRRQLIQAEGTRSVRRRPNPRRSKDRAGLGEHT